MRQDPDSGVPQAENPVQITNECRIARGPSWLAWPAGRPAPVAEAAHDPPHAGGKQSSSGSGGKQHRDACQAGPPGEVCIDPGRSRAGQRQALAPAIAAGDPQHPVPLAGAEVSDAGTDDVADAGAREQQEGH